jgi:hypothetical protein
MHRTSLLDIADGGVDELAGLTVLAPETAPTLGPHERRTCVDISPDEDGTLHLAVSPAEGTDTSAELRSVLPPQIARAVRQATVRAQPVDKENMV